MNSFLRRFCSLVVGAALSSALLHAADTPQRLVNLSTRAQTGTGANAPVVGFVVGEGPAKPILIRAVGPGLNQFLGGSGGISNPLLVVYNSAGAEVARNDNWGTASAGNAGNLANTATFNSVGAFTTLSTNDAALRVTLAPGNYTAQVTASGTTAATGLVLLEVYDISGPARLMNLSTRALVGTGNGIIISGLSIPPGIGIRKVLVRASGPSLGSVDKSLASSVLVDPAIAIYDTSVNPAVQIAANDNWGTDNAAAILAGGNQMGAFPFLANSKDAGLIVDLAPGKNYSLQVSGVNGGTGIALIEVYDLTPDNVPMVSVTATTPTTDTKGAAPAVFTFSRTGSTITPMTVYFTLGGSAVAGLDYTDLGTQVTIPAGASSVSVNLSALTNASAPAINKDASVILLTGPTYAPEPSRATAAATIFYNPGTLYLTQLRASTAAPTSTAFGVSTIQLSADNTFAVVSLNFSNLSSPETVAYLRYGNPGEVGVELLRLPNGQVNNQVWTIQGSGALTAADIVQGIKDGRVYVSIESANYPAGELRGSFLQSNGSAAFTPPPAAPPLADTGLTAVDASRFLAQATFGPTKADIDALTGKRLVDLNNWITAQIALPASLHLDEMRADYFAYDAAREGSTITQNNRQAAWWKLAMTAPDQLRQRVAFALSEILVVSDVNTTLFNNSQGLTNYYDILVRGAFGNFRQTLEEVTLSPIMGFYLSSLRNAKATYDTRTGALLTSPDENYAREVMQLFTIGLNQLQPDGTLKLDALGVPIPTYDQKTITEVAKIFTGWAYYSADANPNFRNAAADWLKPMMLYPAFHEDGPKTIVGGVTVPANQGGVKDLKDMLDTLFNHPNTGPFISRELIQRLVTSNPSPGYIYRVAQVFANNGAGVRGDMAAVVRAILMDYEARSAAVAATASFGHLREPLLRATELLRAFNGGANTGRWAIFNAETGATASIGQAPLRAPTVFNFFEPNFIQPGPLATAGLYAPEYQILTDTAAIAVPNQLWNYIYANRSSGATANAAETTIGFLFDPSLLALANTPQALVDYMNLVLANGGLTKSITDRLVTAITAMPATTDAQRLERLRSSIYLTVSIPQGAIQK